MAKRLRFWGFALLATMLLGFAEAAQLRTGSVAIGRAVEWSRAISATVPGWGVVWLLLPFVLWVARRFPLEGGKFRTSIAAHLPASMAYAFVHLALASWLSDYVFYTDFPLPYGQNFVRLLSIYLVVDMSYYWAIVTAYSAVLYYRKYRQHERSAGELALKTSRLEASLAQANLQALRMQLNPHFLFNTLNTVSVLALKGERQTVARMLSRLSELLRIALENSSQLVPLREELDFLERYLEIEQVRFRDRLTVDMQVEAEVLEAEVPSLILQPLVENAVWHGIAQRPGPGRIDIGARRHGERLELSVRDTGPGFSPTATSRRRGVGLSNTRARLEQIYGADHSITFTNADTGGAVVTVDLPFRRAEAVAELPVYEQRLVKTS